MPECQRLSAIDINNPGCRVVPSTVIVLPDTVVASSDNVTPAAMETPPLKGWRPILPLPVTSMVAPDVVVPSSMVPPVMVSPEMVSVCPPSTFSVAPVLASDRS